MLAFPKKTGAGTLTEVYISAEGVSIEALVIMGPVSLHRTHIAEGIAVNSEKRVDWCRWNRKGDQNNNLRHCLTSGEDKCDNLGHLLPINCCNIVKW